MVVVAVALSRLAEVAEASPVAGAVAEVAEAGSLYLLFTLSLGGKLFFYIYCIAGNVFATLS